jgi:coproporphyrinogen III oxidase-like Fe-S oxidoreductase
MRNEKEGHASPLFLRIGEEKRARILAVAVEEFAENGYTRANVNNIAKNEGISAGGNYRGQTGKRYDKGLQGPYRTGSGKRRNPLGH